MRIVLSIALLIVFSTVMSGCDSKDYVLVPVSGTITFDGKPVDKLRVTFSPKPVGENYAVGPYSLGTTDSQGKFTLKTRYGDDGAIVGAHGLAFQYSDISETAMGDIRMKLAEAQDMKDKALFAEAKKEMDELNAKLKGRPVLKGVYRKVVDVPSGGDPNLELDLATFGQKKEE